MRDHIDEVEFGLTQHPLALYPHFEENCPPDVSVYFLPNPLGDYSTTIIIVLYLSK